MAGANKSNGHPPSTPPHIQPATTGTELTCMQSIEFYGQLGKISKNPQNLGNEQRGSNEGLLMFVTFIEFMKRS